MLYREVRRIIEIGGSYYVAIPKDWARRQGLERGARVYIAIEKDGSIKVSAAEPREPKARSVTIEAEEPELTARRIVTAYLNGYDIIEVRSQRPLNLELRQRIESVAESLAGLEVIEEGDNYMVLQCLGARQMDLYALLGRIGNITKMMLERAAAALAEGKDVSELVRAADRKVDRLYLLAVRMIRQLMGDYGRLIKSGYDTLELLDLRILLRDLEEISDCAERLATRGAELGDRGGLEEVGHILKESAQLLKRVLRAFRERDVREAYACSAMASEMRERLMRACERHKLPADVISESARITELLRDISDLVT